MFTDEQKQGITDVFENAKIEDASASIHVDNLDHNDIVGLATLRVEHDLNMTVKRSGTGITVHITKP